MTFIVATNVVASRPPERRPTGTPHARANYKILQNDRILWIVFNCYKILENIAIEIFCTILLSVYNPYVECDMDVDNVGHWST